MALTGNTEFKNKTLDAIARGGGMGILNDPTSGKVYELSGGGNYRELSGVDKKYGDIDARKNDPTFFAGTGSIEDYLSTYFPNGIDQPAIQQQVDPTPYTFENDRGERTVINAMDEASAREIANARGFRNFKGGDRAGVEAEATAYNEKYPGLNETGLTSGETEAEIKARTNPGGTAQAQREASGQGVSQMKKAKKNSQSSTETGQISQEDYQMKPGESVQAYNDRIAMARGEASQPQNSLDVITDPVTGRSYARDLSIPGSTYKPFSGTPVTTSASTIAPQNQTYSTQQDNAPTELEQLFTNYGYSLSEGASQKFKLAPAASWKEVYNSVTDSLGLGGVKKNIDKTLKDIGKLDQELADKTADINENPWLTEGVRVSQIQKLEERYDLKRAPFASNLTTLQGLYNDGREEARYVATQALQQYNTERNFQLDQIQLMQDQAEKEFEAGLKLYELQNKAPDFGSGSIGEYQFAVSQGYQGSFSEYQNEDANRKISIARAGVGSGSGLTPYQENQTFIGLTNKYQADQIVNAGVKGQTAVAIADQVIANPQNAANQLKALYTLVKNLDPDSAVREGEVDLAQKTQSYLQTFETSLARITRGQVIAPAAAVALATATKELALAWSESAARRQRQYQAQAQVGNVGGQFNQYLGAFDSGFAGGGGSADDPLGLR